MSTVHCIHKALDTWPLPCKQAGLEHLQPSPSSIAVACCSWHSIFALICPRCMQEIVLLTASTPMAHTFFAISKDDTTKCEEAAASTFQGSCLSAGSLRS